MTINHSLDCQAFEVLIEKFLVPELWVGSVVVRDNLPADKMAYIAILAGAVNFFPHPNPPRCLGEGVGD
jgi:putative transposase